jgi:hypothetical protein
MLALELNVSCSTSFRMSIHSFGGVTMSSQESESSGGALELDRESVDPFTKIRFHPHEGIMSLAPIRPGILKEIDAATQSHDATQEVTL